MFKASILAIALLAGAAQAQTSKTEWVAVPVDPAASGSTTKAICTAAVKKLYGASLTCMERVKTSPAPTSPTATWSFLGMENDAVTLTVPAGSTVRFGKGDVWTEKVITGTTLVCWNGEFGPDKLPTIVKQCEIRGGVPQPPVVGSASLRWTAPTLKADGTPLTGPLTYRVQYGIASGSYTASATSSTTTLTIPNLSPARWYFVIRAVAAGLESAPSAEVSKTVQ